MIGKIELVLVLVEACLWKRRFKVIYAEGNYKRIFESQI